MKKKFQIYYFMDYHKKKIFYLKLYDNEFNKIIESIYFNEN